MDARWRILHLEDSPRDAELVEATLKTGGLDCEVIQVKNREEFEAACAQDRFDVILCDYSLPQYDGSSALGFARHKAPAVPFILLSGTLGEELAVESLKTGATDYILKDRLHRLVPAVRRAVREAQERNEKQRAEEELQAAHAQLRQLLAHSPAVIFTVKLDGQEEIPQVVSENITALLGFTVEETLRCEWWVGQLHPEDRERAVASVSETPTQGTSLTEYRLRHKEGGYRWVEDKRRLIRDSANRPKEIVGVWADITERKRAEEVMREVSLREIRPSKSNAVEDLVAVLAFGALVFAAAYFFDLFEKPVELILKHKETPLDEFFGTLIVLGPLLAVFGYRRWKEMRNKAVGPQRADGVTRPVSVDEVHRRQSKAVQDLSVLLGFGVLVFALTYAFSLFERPIEWICQHRQTVADELFGTLIILSPALAIFARRRWKETVAEATEHQRTAGALRILHDELDKRVQQRTAELAKSNESLRSEITERKRAELELDKTHKELLEASRQAGMAEVATSVLHNVGNVLNSVNVASSCMAESLKKSKAASLSKVVALLREHEADLGAFISSDPQGKQIPGYLAKLADHLAGEQTAALGELAQLQKNIEHIKEIVSTQQSCARVSGVAERVKAMDLVEDALRMNASSLSRRDIQILKAFEELPPVMTQKHKVLQILVNLIRNANQACDESGHSDNRLTLRVARNQNGVSISVSDNGVGIPPENLTRIFAHGFTTKKDGHGFGLHGAALAAKELGGSLSVRSEGVGRGATFILELPLEHPGRSAAPVTNQTSPAVSA
jgi:PAS domain S-box-containing protein